MPPLVTLEVFTTALLRGFRHYTGLNADYATARPTPV